MRGKRTSGSKFSGPSRAAILKSDKAGWVKLVTPYDADFVDDLKSSIQPSHRQWDPNIKAWLVSDIWLEDCVDILNRHFSDVTTDLVAEEVKPENLFKTLFDALPKDHHDKVFRVLAVALHPDHGGSNELMAQLNLAFQENKSA